jgi:hypothetical protein
MECFSLAHRCGGAAEEISLLLEAHVERVEANGRKIVLPSSVLGTLNDRAQPLDCTVSPLDSPSAAQSREIKQVHCHLSSLGGMPRQNAVLVGETAVVSEALKMQATEPTGTLGCFMVA